MVYHVSRKNEVKGDDPAESVKSAVGGRDFSSVNFSGCRHPIFPPIAVKASISVGATGYVCKLNIGALIG